VVASASLEQSLGIDVEQGCGQGGVGQVVFRDGVASPSNVRRFLR
jgi:hypothetical protein